jgi:hypothetical protein
MKNKIKRRRWKRKRSTFQYTKPKDRKYLLGVVGYQHKGRSTYLYKGKKGKEVYLNQK